MGSSVDEEALPAEKAPLRQLFMFATRQDRLMFAAGLTFTACGGLCWPIPYVLMGQAFGGANFGDLDFYTDIAWQLSVVGGAIMVFNYLATVLIDRCKETQMGRFRAAYLKAILRQDVGWFDTNQPTSLASSMNRTMIHVESGLASSTWVMVEALFRFVGSIVVGLEREWSVALVAMAGGPFCIYALVRMVRTLKATNIAVGQAQAKAGSVALESLAAVRTVAAFGLEEQVLSAYGRHIEDAKQSTLQCAGEYGRNLAVLMTTGQLLQGLTSVYVVLMIAREAASTARELTMPLDGELIHFCTPGCSYDLDSLLPPAAAECSESSVALKLTCGSADLLALNHGQLGPNLNNFSAHVESRFVELGSHLPCHLSASRAYTTMVTVSIAFLILGIGARPAQFIMHALVACRSVVDVIHRIPTIDAFSSEGRTLESKGAIELREVSFAYPSSPTHAICRGCSLHIDAGEVCALVGPSGSGKSTVIQLIERFYDPQSGCVLFDGVDIKTLNLQWLRSQLGLVSQEPVLFMGTVAENIGYGQPGARQDQIEASARMANAHTFIMESLGDGYRTQVGLRGSKLSGGQKQRVAIARALVRNPTVLLLDEATSALDNESERIVQSALDKVVAERKRTTLTIAHRLSTIRDADRIIVLSGGAVVEEGTHAELLSKQGLYAPLAQRQESARALDSKLVLHRESNQATDSTAAAAVMSPTASGDEPNEATLRGTTSTRFEATAPTPRCRSSNPASAPAGVDAPSIEVVVVHGSKPKSSAGLTTWQAVMRIASIQLSNANGRRSVATGLICSVLAGALAPVGQLIFVRLIVVLLFKYDPDVILLEGLSYGGGLTACALLTMAVTSIELVSFKTTSEHVNSKLRSGAHAILQPVRGSCG